MMLLPRTVYLRPSSNIQLIAEVDRLLRWLSPVQAVESCHAFELQEAQPTAFCMFCLSELHVCIQNSTLVSLRGMGPSHRYVYVQCHLPPIQC